MWFNPKQCFNPHFADYPQCCQFHPFCWFNLHLLVAPCPLPFPPCGEAGSKVPAPSACESSSELSAANGEGRELRDELRIAPRLIIISGDPKATFSDPIFVGVPYFACRKHSNVGQLWI